MKTIGTAIARSIINYQTMSDIDKKRVWLTYSWEDNKQGEVDTFAQTLEQSGLEVEMDRNTLGAGEGMWLDIAKKIENPSLSGWLMYATQNSLNSKKCLEELGYALHQALNRSEQFPIIGFFPSPVDQSMIPLAIKTRFYVRMKDPDWKERIVSSLLGEAVNIEKPDLTPYYFNATFVRDELNDLYIHEMRPRIGVWSPFVVAIKMSERDSVKPFLLFGPANSPNIQSGRLTGSKEDSMNSGQFWGITGQEEASPTQSYYLVCSELPTLIIFGQLGKPLHQMNIDQSVVKADLEKKLKELE